MNRVHKVLFLLQVIFIFDLATHHVKIGRKSPKCFDPKPKSDGWCLALPPKRWYFYKTCGICRDIYGYCNWDNSTTGNFFSSKEECESSCGKSTIRSERCLKRLCYQRIPKIFKDKGKFIECQYLILPNEDY